MRIVNDGPVKHVPVDDLVPHPRNPRQGDVGAIATSIDANGFYGVLVVQRSTGYVLAGNHRLAAAKADGAAKVPVQYVDVDDETALRILLADNRTNDLASYDDAGLADLLSEIAEAGPDALLGTGYDGDDLDALVADLGRSTDDAPDTADTPSLSDRFLVPPFSILDARLGWWQDRKRRWLALGIESQIGRGEDVAPNLGQGLKTRRGPDGGLVYVDIRREETRTGISIFDPVLCEIIYRWFSAPGGMVLDPFAGGSVRGIVAGALDRDYHGIDLRPEQIAANVEQGTRIPTVRPPTWTVGDSRTVLADAPTADLIFACPPYADLEVYSDDPSDLSTMRYSDFRDAHAEIIRGAVDRLADDRFAVWVVGEARGSDGRYYGLVPDTVQAFSAAGCGLYNEAILVTPPGSVPIRAGRQFATSRKLGKTHQNVLVFVKGDARRAADAAGEVSVEEALAEIGDAYE